MQGCSQDFCKGGAQLEGGIEILCGKAVYGQLCWPQGVGMGGGCAPSRQRWKLLAFLAQQLSISTDFYLFLIA